MPSLIERLVQIPYLMRPGLSRIDADHFRLTACNHNQFTEKLKNDKLFDHSLSLSPDLVCNVAKAMLPLVEPRYIGWFEYVQPVDLLEVITMHHMEDIAVMNSAGQFQLLYIRNPSGWAPDEHLGSMFASVHARLPDADLIKKSSEHLVKLVCGGDSWRRTVWTLSPSPALCRHPKLAAAQASWDTTDKIYLRWEEQTFLPFVPGEQVIFVIKVQTQELGQACVSYQDAIRIDAALETMSDSVRAYKGLDNPRVYQLLRQVMDKLFNRGI